MIKLREIINYLEHIAPLSFQESYDNAGLITGDINSEISSALITLDVTESVIDEAISKNIKLIVSHHPIVFSGIKKITGKNYIERVLIKAIKHDIAIYAAHTNLDSANNGVNHKICQKLELQDCSVLQPLTDQLKKLVTFVPKEKIGEVQDAVFKAGAGNIGNYDSCGFTTIGKGSFRGNEMSTPSVGEKGKFHMEEEIRFETIFPSYLQKNIIQALLNAHPYEEVAYDIYSLENDFQKAGMGMIGTLKEDLSETEFLKQLKETFNTGVIKHTSLLNKPVRKVKYKNK